MIDVTNGEVSTREGLVIGPNYSFDKFKTTKFYNGQDGVRIIYLDEHQTIYGRQFIMSLFFRDGIIYMVSLICCDEKFSESNERDRKKIHDKILTEMGLLQGDINGERLYQNMTLEAILVVLTYIILNYGYTLGLS